MLTIDPWRPHNAEDWKEVRLFKQDVETDRKLRSELRKAENRERIAQCKLERLKERFDKLYEEISECQDELAVTKGECSALKKQVEIAQRERERASQEALMWRTQLFERMELLEDANQQLHAAEHELELAWERAGHANQSHQASHAELRKRDKERLTFELKIEELQKAQRETRDQANDLLEALTDAESAISSLQRSNDKYQRQVDGLKSLGASLTEKLTQLTEQRDKYRETASTVTDVLRLEREQNEHQQSEIERLKNELYEVKGQLIAYKLEADVRESRLAGEQKATERSTDKYGKFPSTESRIVQPIGGSLLSKATKTMTGWFKVSSGESDRDVSRN